MGLKEVVIVVRPEKAIITEQILLEGGADYVLRHKVEGRGKEMGQVPTKSWFGLSVKTQTYAFFHKTLLSAWIDEVKIPAIIDEIVHENQSHHYGDGRIFILSANGK